MKRSKTLIIAACILIVLIAFIVFSYMYWNGYTSLRFISPAEEDQVKIACIGNSTTYGYGISDWPTKNYPYILSTLLGEDYHVANFGLSSHCVQDSADKPYRSTGVFSQSVAYDADVIILMMGANDAKAENWQGIDAFKKNYLSLLDAYLQGAQNVEVFLCTLAYTHPTSDGTVSFNIQPEAVAEISAMVRDIATEKGYHLLDINTLTTGHPEWFQEDGIHPNADGAKAMAEYIADALNDNLK